ncbi:hypothetical protein [Acinetobacter phage Ab69]|nr:hypothetical protein [Acinetobacter phage Ab69]
MVLNSMRSLHHTAQRCGLPQLLRCQLNALNGLILLDGVTIRRYL